MTENKYPASIMDTVRRRLGLEGNDASKDARINVMSRNKVFDACLEWEGLIDWGHTIRGWIKDIYGVDLK